MAKVRYIGDEPVAVPELFGHDRYIEPDEVVTVPDDRFDGYICQPHTWEAVEEPPGWNTPDPAEPPGEDTASSLAALSPGERAVKKSTVKKTTAAKTEPRKED